MMAARTMGKRRATPPQTIGGRLRGIHIPATLQRRGGLRGDHMPPMGKHAKGRLNNDLRHPWKGTSRTVDPANRRRSNAASWRRELRDRRPMPIVEAEVPA